MIQITRKQFTWKISLGKITRKALLRKHYLENHLEKLIAKIIGKNDLEKLLGKITWKSVGTHFIKKSSQKRH